MVVSLATDEPSGYNVLKYRHYLNKEGFSFRGLILGSKPKNESKTTITSKDLTDITVEAISKNTSVTSSSVSQTASIVAHGPGTVVRGNVILQKANISMDAMTKTDANSSMQADIVKALDNKVKNEQKHVNSVMGGNNKSETEVTNIIQTSVALHFSVSALQKLSASIDQTATIEATGGAKVKNTRIAQEAVSVASQASKLSSDLMSKLYLESDIANDVANKQSNSLDLGFMTFFIVLAALAVGAILLTLKFVTNPYAIAGIIVLVLVLTFGGGAVAYFTSTKKKGDDDE